MLANNCYETFDRSVFFDLGPRTINLLSLELGISTIERLGESGATHDSQSASRSGVEAWVARNLNGWDDSDAGLSKG